MSVKPEELQTPERDLRLTTRGGAAPAERKRDAPAEPDAAGELAALRDRIEDARRLTPEDTNEPGKLRHLHCEECFRRGRDATIRAIESGKG